MEDTMNDFNMYLKRAREKAGYTFVGLAKKVGVHPSMIYQYELKSVPSFAIAKRIADALDTSVETLFPKIYETSDNSPTSISEISPDQLIIRDTPEKPLIDEELRGIIQYTLSTLSQREQQYLKKIYGLDDEIKYSIREIGRSFHTSHVNVRRIHKGAIKKLRKLCLVALEDFL
jgi:RNA polymerase sigma factor (sigma-70 family)